MNFNRLKWVYLIGFFLILTLPLLNLPPWFSPPDWGKTIVFRIILALIIFLFLWEFLSGKTNFRELCSSKFSKQVKIGFALLLALLGINFLATIFSLNPHFSLWGSPYRSGGFLNFSFYIIFAILAFLILEKSDWQKIWGFAIIIGVLVSIVAVLQFFQILGRTLIPYKRNPPSTLGNSIFLAIYLLFLTFLALSFGLRAKRYLKKILYFLPILLFLFVILVTETRAAYLGLVIGILYFLLFYPKRLFWLKIAAVLFLVLIISVVYYLNTKPQLPEFIQNSRILTTIASRLSLRLLSEQERFPAWEVSIKAIKERPIFGWGPENYSIGFDKYYDPSLPHFANITWWDRAHNFVFDISVTTGIPALIIYLAVFGVLFWQLQKVKYADLRGYKKRSPRIIIHGIQAAFIGYLVANFFSFDCFSTYLMSFLLIGYSFYLISQTKQGEQKSGSKRFQELTLWKLGKYRGLTLFVFFVVLIWFIWFFNLKPLLINTKINWANYYSKNGKCEEALAVMEKILPSESIVNHYLRLRYTDIISNCLEKMPERKLALAQKAIQILKENTKLRPYYTRNWLLLGSYTNILLANSKEPQLTEKLKNEANTYFEKANQLSPKRQQVFIGWPQTYLFAGEYQKAKEKAQKCIDLNPETAKCWWLMGLAQIGLSQTKEAQENINVAKEKGFPTDAKKSLLQLVRAYGDAKNYKPLVGVYKKLISLEPKNFQYHASLAYVYKMIGDYKKARSEAFIVLKLSPESKKNVEDFLKTLQ